MMERWLNKIHCGPCEQVMQEIPTGSVDLVVTSPPYNLLNSTGHGMNAGESGRWKNAQLKNGYEDHNDNMPHDEYVKWQRDCLGEMFRVINEEGAIFYNHKYRVQGGLLQDRADIVHGFPVRQIIIWKRSGGMNFNEKYFLPTYEVIYLICKSKFKLKKGMVGLGDVWEFPQESKNEHPAPFPIGLPKRCIESTNAKVVLDPFMGSGTTAIAAINAGRNYIGIEKSIRYCKMAERNIEQSKKQNALFTPNQIGIGVGEQIEI